jgi:hypothetical protein
MIGPPFKVQDRSGRLLDRDNLWSAVRDQLYSPKTSTLSGVLRIAFNFCNANTCASAMTIIKKAIKK